MSTTSSAPVDDREESARNVPSFAAELAAIGVGGAIGAGLRYSVSLAVATAGLPDLLGVTIANLLGSFALGLIVGHLDSGRPHPLLRPFFTVGVLGSFTTFSALALDSIGLAGEQGDVLAAGFLGGSIALGLAAFSVGDLIGARLRDDPTR